jgi:L-ascorbate metabolism protein UlaG (beta-lactamase superfamily)
MLHPHGKTPGFRVVVVSNVTRSLVVTLISSMVLLACSLAPSEPVPVVSPGRIAPASDHFDGKLYFNPSVRSIQASGSSRGSYRWLWRWMLGINQPEWPDAKEQSISQPLIPAVSKGSTRITSIGHATFLIQMDGVNILTDPIWSDRCSPVSWAGPKRHQKPGMRFEDLPPIDVVLISHNHYDHLDVPTLKRLAKKGSTLAIVPLGNFDLVKGAGIPVVHELDWWQSNSISRGVKVTLVPAQHFSSRSPWDRNKTLWGGFVISGPSGNFFFAGDTGYGPHFQEIARRFSPIRVALLPISPFRPTWSKEPPRDPRLSVHMGPTEAVQAHIDLGAEGSIAAHFQVFQLGWDGFDDAVNGLAAVLSERRLNPQVFLALNPGHSKLYPCKMSAIAEGGQGTQPAKAGAAQDLDS